MFDGIGSIVILIRHWLRRKRVGSVGNSAVQRQASNAGRRNRSERLRATGWRNGSTGNKRIRLHNIFKHFTPSFPPQHGICSLAATISPLPERICSGRGRGNAALPFAIPTATTYHCHYGHNREMRNQAGARRHAEGYHRLPSRQYQQTVIILYF